ncbi:MAG TPA: YIP1 family protein, partial [Chthonomonadales bacterium]|nr:YIP1 family protein [Chthonomonadales bacterium]
MSAERDEGLAALQSGDTTSAIEKLQRAVELEPEDFQAHLYLGAAYGGAEKHDEAIRALTRAVELQPGNAQARYNLGVALDRAGWKDQAETALQQALTLQPGYSNASEALANLQRERAAAQQPQALFPTAAPHAPQPTGQYPAAGQQAAPLSEPRAAQAPTLLGAPAPQYGAPSGQVSEGYGSVPPPRQAGAYGYAPPPGYPTYPQAAGGAYSQFASQNAEYVPDRFSIPQAFRDLGEILTAPGRFFQGQVDREGHAAPFAMFLVYVLLGIVAAVIAAALTDSPKPAGERIAISVTVAVVACVFVIPFIYLASGLIHIVGKLFGSRAGFSGSFRCIVYGYAPAAVLGLVGALLSPIGAPPAPATVGAESAKPHMVLAQYEIPSSNGPQQAPLSSPGYGQNPLAGVAQRGPLSSITSIIGWIWALCVTTIGVARVQRLSTGG